MGSSPLLSDSAQDGRKMIILAIRTTNRITSVTGRIASDLRRVLGKLQTLWSWLPVQMDNDSANS